MKKKIFVSLVFAVVSAVAFANPWSYHGPKRDIVTLIVTANYEKPRLIAELIQDESRQPFLLLPANNDGNIYFCPPNFGKPKVVPRQKLSRIIAFIAPKQIIVLGNERYVSDAYVKELRKIAPVCVINAESWQLAADTVAPMLNLSKLPRSFRKLNEQLDSGRLYLPKKYTGNNADSELVLTADPAEKDSTVAEEPKINKPAKKNAPAKNEQYPAFDADEKPAKGAKSSEVAPLA